MVELVEARESLWDFCSPDYRNRDLKTLCWSEVAERTKHSAADTKIQWNSIRSRFNTEQRKVMTTKSGQGGSTYQSTFSLFNALQFLSKTDVNSQRETLTNLTIETEVGDGEMASVSQSSTPQSPECSGKTPSFKKPKQTPVMDVELNTERTALMGKISDFLDKEKALSEETKWRRAFVEFIFHELNRYDEHNAHSLKQQLLMQWLNFVPEDRFVVYEPAYDDDDDVQLMTDTKES